MALDYESVAGVDWRPEALLAAELKQGGIRCRVRDKRLPGTPHISVQSRQVAIFVLDCYWHGCEAHYPIDSVNDVARARQVWRDNKRIGRAKGALMSVGWRVVELWAHEIRKNPRAAAIKALSRSGPGLNLGKGKTARL